MHVPLGRRRRGAQSGPSSPSPSDTQGAPKNKSFAGAWAEAGLRGARGRSTIGAEPPGLCLPHRSTTLLRSAPLGSALLGSGAPS